MDRENKISLIVAGTIITGAILFHSGYNSAKGVYVPQYQELLQEQQHTKQELESLTGKFKTESDKAKKLEADLKKAQEELEKAEEVVEMFTRDISYNPDDLRQVSNISIPQLMMCLKDTGLEGLERAFIHAESTYKINALFLVGLVANESTWGTSDRAVNQNNLTGYAVYSSKSRGGYFSSKEECIFETAQHIAENYLVDGAEHFNGYGIRDVNVEYCLKDGQPNYEWTKTIDSIATDFKEKVNRFA